MSNTGTKQGFATIKCADQPKEGRSGGGLYTTDGYVAGVCDFADPNEHVGLYAVPEAIHRLLDRNQLMALYKPATDQPETTARLGRRPVPAPTLGPGPVTGPDRPRREHASARPRRDHVPAASTWLGSRDAPGATTVRARALAGADAGQSGPTRRPEPSRRRLGRPRRPPGRSRPDRPRDGARPRGPASKSPKPPTPAACATRRPRRRRDQPGPAGAVRKLASARRGRCSRTWRVRRSPR